MLHRVIRRMYSRASRGERKVAAARKHISDPALTLAHPVNLSECLAGYVLGCNIIVKAATELDDA